MPTLEQIENGASHYDIEEAKALYEAQYLRSLGADCAGEVELKARKYERIARELRALSSDA